MLFFSCALEDLQKKIPTFHPKKNVVKIDKRYRLEISIDAPTALELYYGILQIQNMIKNTMQKNVRISVNDTIIDYTLDRYGDHNYRVEEINGKLCYIFKSKMNEK